MKKSSNILRIKKSNRLTPLFLLLSVLLLSMSIYCVVNPLLKQMDLTLTIIYYSCGGLGTLYFAYLSFNYLFQLISPKNAVLLSTEGFADMTIAGVGTGFLPWTAVRGTSVFADGKKRYLGIRLRNPEKLLAGFSPAVRKEIADNIDSSLPELVINQADIASSVDELDAAFNEYMENYRTLLFRKRMPDKRGDTNDAIAIFHSSDTEPEEEQGAMTIRVPETDEKKFSDWMSGRQEPKEPDEDSYAHPVLVDEKPTTASSEEAPVTHIPAEKIPEQEEAPDADADGKNDDFTLAEIPSDDEPEQKDHPLTIDDLLSQLRPETDFASEKADVQKEVGKQTDTPASTEKQSHALIDELDEMIHKMDD